MDPRVMLTDSRLRFAIMFLVIALRLFQSFLDKVHGSLGRPDAGRRLLLEGVKHIHRLCESNGVHRPIGISACDSTISRTPGPSPFHGFAVGAIPPN
jgi:hypothetical protein